MNLLTVHQPRVDLLQYLEDVIIFVFVYIVRAFIPDMLISVVTTHQNNVFSMSTSFTIALEGNQSDKGGAKTGLQRRKRNIAKSILVFICDVTTEVRIC